MQFDFVDAVLLKFVMESIESHAAAALPLIVGMDEDIVNVEITAFCRDNDPAKKIPNYLSVNN